MVGLKMRAEFLAFVIFQLAVNAGQELWGPPLTREVGMEAKVGWKGIRNPYRVMGSVYVF